MATKNDKSNTTDNADQAAPKTKRRGRASYKHLSVEDRTKLLVPTRFDRIIAACTSLGKLHKPDVDAPAEAIDYMRAEGHAALDAALDELAAPPRTGARPAGSRKIPGLT